mmetsp:Transcript_31636/g.82707  ORF Transcript_31636/g.82707 Transcript_31636/m.82707 type:complete len:211 (+) Transcript_31636:858-1490(+)
MIGEVTLRNIVVRVARSRRGHVVTGNVAALSRLDPRVLPEDDALALCAVRRMDGALVEPVLLLLRAHFVHTASLQIILGDLVDQLVGEAGRSAEVVLAGTCCPRRGVTLDTLRELIVFVDEDVSTADTHAGGANIQDPPAQGAQRGRVVLVLEINVAIADCTTATVATVELLKIMCQSFERVVLCLRGIKIGLAALRLVLLPLAHLHAER